MKYILASLPALMSVASAAEIMGTYYMPADPAPASVAAVSQATSQATAEATDATSTSSVPSSDEVTLSMATVTQPMDPAQTPELATSSWAATEEMPYWHMTQDGYQSMDCGYGWYKDTRGYCQRESWVRAVSYFISFSSLICRSDCSIPKRSAMRLLSSTSG